MTPKEFHKLCSDHDWFYPYSDDQRYWRAGVAEAAVLTAAMTAQPELTPIYNEWVVWLNNPDNSKQAPVSPE